MRNARDHSVSRTPFITQRDLVKRLICREQLAYKDLYLLYQGCVATVLQWYTQDKQEIRCGIEATILDVWTHMPEYNCTKGTLLTWVLEHAKRQGDVLLIKRELEKLL